MLAMLIISCHYLNKDSLIILNSVGMLLFRTQVNVFIIVNIKLKTLLNVERYLTCDMPLHLRSALSKFRCGNFQLAVETGRYVNVTYSERICVYCKSINVNSVEDELHVFLKCTHFSDLRVKYIQKYLNGHNELLNFINILRSNNECVIRNVCTFLYYVLKRKRNDHVHKK